MEIPSFDYEEIMKSQQNHDKIGENETKIEANKIQQPVKEELKNDNFIPVGLKKLDGIIYVNPVLQFLSGIQEFEEYFIQNTNNFKQNAKYICSYITSRLYFHIYKDEKIKKTKVYDSSNYLNVLNYLNISICKDNNIKINDILTMILDILNIELKEEKNVNENLDKFNHYNLDEVIKYGYLYYINNNNSIITKILNNFLLQTIECPKCSKKYYEMKSFPTFELNITDAYENKVSPGGNKIISLQECLNNETINNKKSILFYCNSCSNYTTSNKVLYQFYKMGDKLIFLLERDSLEKGNNNNKSNNIIVNIDEKIYMKDYAYSDKINLKYELIGIISSEIKQNRYVCFLKSFYNQKWYLYIDEYIEEKKLSDILNEHNNEYYAPYTLLYSRIKN